LFENHASRCKKPSEERFGHEHFDIVHMIESALSGIGEDEVQVVCELTLAMTVVFPSKRDDSDRMLSFEVEDK
jgi:copper oxidase (laccase) domain-containing protein